MTPALPVVPGAPWIEPATGATHFQHGIDTPVISINGVPTLANVGGVVVSGTAIPGTVQAGATHFPHGVVSGDGGTVVLSLGGVPAVGALVGVTHFPHGIDLGD